jgi:hypothetical protein
MGFLFRLDPLDYKRWAQGLKKAGYATSATYAEKLISIIERYDLDRFDKMLPGDLDEPVADVLEAGIFINNDVKYATAGANETVADIAKRTDTSLRSLLKYNEQLTNGNQELEEGERVYIQPKRSGYRAKRQKWHVMRADQKMFDVSQTYGVKLKKLLKRNRLEEAMQPAEGAMIKLRGCKVKDRPQLASEVEVMAPLPELEMEVDDESFEEVPEIEPAPKPDTTAVIPPEIIEEEPLLPVEDPEDAPEPTEGPTSEPDFTDEPITDQPEVSPQPEAGVYHTVAEGDTLWNISKRYNTTVDAIKKLNKLADNTIRLGMKLRVK